jgi:hypothetical protein
MWLGVLTDITRRRVLVVAHGSVLAQSQRLDMTTHQLAERTERCRQLEEALSQTRAELIATKVNTPPQLLLCFWFLSFFCFGFLISFKNGALFCSRSAKNSLFFWWRQKSHHRSNRQPGRMRERRGKNNKQTNRRL